MNKGRVNVFLVTRTPSERDGGIFKTIKGNHGGNPRIEIVRSSRAFESKGLTTLIYQNRNRGVVCIIREEFSENVIKVATNTGVPFWIISRNNKGWTSSCINQCKVTAPTEVIASSVPDSQMAR